MASNIEHWNTGADGELSEAAMRKKPERMGYRVATYVYPPGTRFPEHSHEVNKIDGVLSGQFKMTLAGRSVVLTAGDMQVVPRGVVHSAEVIGDEAVISLDAVRP